MRRKEAVAAVVVAGALLAVVLGLWGFQRWQDARATKDRVDAAAAVPTYGMGETATFTRPLDSSDPTAQGSGPFEGTLSVRVDEATLLLGPDQAAESAAWDEAYFTGGVYYTPEMRASDPFDLLVYRVSITNVAAAATDRTRSGDVLFALDSVAHLSPSNEIVYLSPNLPGYDVGFFSLEAGEEREFVVGCAVRRENADAGAFSVSDSSGLGYRVDLAVRDMRREASS